MNTLRNHFIKASLKPIPPLPEYYIQYTSNSGAISFANPVFGANIIDNYYDDYYNCYFGVFDGPITQMGNYAFYERRSLTSMVIPNGVTSIGDGAFGYCTSLRSITIPNSVTRIGQYAFRYCSSLSSVTIPNSVTSIRNTAFYDCKALTNIIFQGTIAQWEVVSLGDSWNKNVPATVIHCTDGDVAL